MGKPHSIYSLDKERVYCIMISAYEIFFVFVLLGLVLETRRHEAT